jgi:large subunit ribosomal protein L18
MLDKNIRRLRRKSKIRNTVSWTSSKPRLSIFKSNVNIYAQLIDDTEWKTICSFSDIKITEWTKTLRAEKVWEGIAKTASEKKIKDVVFDRNWFAYTGRVKALADAARKAWLQF